MDQHDESYDGCANYETWCVNRWLTTNEELSRQCRELAVIAADAALHSSLVFDGIWTTAESARNLLADALREFVDELNPLADQSSFFTDLMDAALCEVHWPEIADEFLKGESVASSPGAVL